MNEIPPNLKVSSLITRLFWKHFRGENILKMLYTPVICRVDWTQSKLNASRLSLMAMSPLCCGRRKPAPVRMTEWASASTVQPQRTTLFQAPAMSFLFFLFSQLIFSSLSLSFPAHYFWCSFIILPLQSLAAYWFLSSCPSF